MTPHNAPEQSMKILIVHQYFLGKDDAGGSRWNQFARYWAEAGHEITILAGTVHYNSGQKAPQYKGKFVVREQEMPGVTVYRCHVSESYNKSFVGRAWAYLSFAFSSTYAGLFKAGRPDIILATSPPLTVAKTMSWLKFWRRRPVVFEVRDLWPESAIDTGRHSAGTAGQYALPTGTQGVSPRRLDQRADACLRTDSY